MNFSRFFILCISMVIVGYGCSNANFDANQRTADKSSDNRDGLEGIGEISRASENQIPAEYDSNNDGKADFLDDADGDGYPDGWVDTDGDGVPDDLPDSLKEIIGSASSMDGESPIISGSAKEDGLVEVNDCDLAKARATLKLQVRLSTTALTQAKIGSATGTVVMDLLMVVKLTVSKRGRRILILAVTKLSVA